MTKNDGKVESVWTRKGTIFSVCQPDEKMYKKTALGFFMLTPPSLFPLLH